MKKVAVILSGSGVFDGSEIHEAVLTMLSLDKRGVELIITAPDMEQYHVINHITGEVMDQKRSVLVESARLARGKIVDIKKLSPEDVDGVMIPGGFGAAKNLSTYAFKGIDCDVNEDVLNFLTSIVEMEKPIGAVCIAPAVLSKVYQKLGKPVELTIGNDKGTAEHIETMGNKHFSCPVNGFHVDKKNKVVSTPAYMLGKSISEVAEGIDNTVDAFLKLL